MCIEPKNECECEYSFVLPAKLIMQFNLYAYVTCISKLKFMMIQAQ